MTSPNTLKNSLVVILARTWIRYAPTVLFKQRLWRFVHWRNHRYLASNKLGFRMAGQSADLVQGYIYYFGVWEPNLTAWLSGRLRTMADGVFLDVGANVGYYSLLAHKLMPESSAVVSIEASPMIHSALVENIRLNRFERIRTLYHALEENLGGSTTKKGVWASEGIVVPAKPLSEILTADEISRTRLIKIDVEGAEWSVLQGLRPILGQLNTDVEIVVELSGDVDSIFAMFSQAGFNAYKLVNHYSYKNYLTPEAIAPPVRIAGARSEHGDVIFSRRAAPQL